MGRRRNEDRRAERRAHVANAMRLVDDVSRAAGAQDIDLTVVNARLSGVHWKFDRRGKRVLDYWPATGSWFRPGGGTGKARDPWEALAIANGADPPPPANLFPLPMTGNGSAVSRQTPSDDDAPPLEAAAGMPLHRFKHVAEVARVMGFRIVARVLNHRGEDYPCWKLSRLKTGETVLNYCPRTGDWKTPGGRRGKAEHPDHLLRVAAFLVQGREPEPWLGKTWS